MIAIAVTAVTAGAAAAAVSTTAHGILGGLSALATGGLSFGATVAIGAGAAALGSIVSQGIGVATGLQDKFSWKGVALAALGGAVGGALNGAGVFAKIGLGGNVAGSQFLGNVARGMVSSVATQGLAVATGLQSKFDWVGVAAAGVGAGVGGAVGGKLPGLNLDKSIGNRLAHLGTSTASLLANAATRSVLSGTSFGDNVMAALPDVIAQTIGDFVVDTIAEKADQRSRVKRDAEALLALDGPEANTPERRREAIAILNDATIAAKRLDLTDPGTADRFVDIRDEAVRRIVRSKAGKAELARGYALLSRNAASPASNSNIESRNPSSGDPNGSQSTQDEVEPIVVTGQRLPKECGVAIHPFLDRPSVELGNFAFNVSGNINKAIQSTRGARTALTIIDFSLTLAGGLPRYLASKAYGQVEDQVIDGATKRFEAANYRADSPAGGAGVPILGSIVAGGVKAGLGTATKVASLVKLARERGAAESVGDLVRIGKNRLTFQGMEVRAVRDLSHMSDSTLQAMATRGFSGKTANGESIVLHHHRQNPNGFIVELPTSKHSIGNVNQHPYGNAKGMGLTTEQRTAFDTWRVDYWKARAQSELQRRAGQ